MEKRNNSKQISFQEKKDINKTISRFEKEVEKSENTVSELEAEIKQIDQSLSSHNTLNDNELFEKYTFLKNKLEKEMHNWEVNHEELEKWKKKKTW